MNTKNIRVYVQHVPIADQVFWCIAMVTAIVIFLSVMIALWQFGSVGCFFLGFLLCWLMRK